MSEQETSADQHILAQQKALQAKLKRSIWIGAAVIAVLLVLYIANQAFQDKADAETISDEIVVDPDEVTLTTNELEQYRDKFRTDLADFESTLQPILENQDIINWQPKSVASLEAEKERALGEFARSSFQTASNTLSELAPKVQQLEQDWRIAYQEKITESEAFLAEEKINQARFAFSQAVKIMPANPDGNELQLKLDGYEEILNVRQAFRVAQVENNVTSQIELLEKLISLDPSLTRERDTLAALKRDRVSSQHAAIVLQANNALDNNRVSEARELLSQAKALRPKDPATKTLAQRIANQSAQSALSRRLAEVETLASQQQWQQVLQKSSSYAAMHPGQDRFAELEAQASEIVQVQTRVAQFLSRPERVADANIRDAAVETLQNSLLLSSSSSELSNQLGQLAAVIDKYSQSLKVTINSDEASHISVLGVGHVGVVKQKQIELKPGQYTLEARRDGFKTKRMQISVSATSENTFFLASNEKI
ncbi:MAG: hypothetical protein AAGJ37_06250 [Pseudomonadota bacterium]